MKNSFVKAGYLTLVFSVLLTSLVLPQMAKADVFTVFITANPSSPSVGQAITFTANPTGGTAPYTYAWGGCNPSGQTCVISSAASGDNMVSVTVTDSNGVGASANLTVTTAQNPPPSTLSVTLDANPNNPSVGQSITFTANPTGGTAPYTYAWGGCTSNGTNICVVQSAVNGNNTVSVTVTDSNGVGASRNLTITANQTPPPPPQTPFTVSITANPNTVSIGQTVTYTTTITGGTAPYTYSFGGCSQTGSSCTATYQTAGTFPNAVSVTVTDANGVGASASGSITVSGAISCNTNAQCGTNGPTGGLFCQGNNVYQNYITYTCNNPGTANSSCSNATNAQLQTTCTGSQTCNNGSCTGGGGAYTISLSYNPTTPRVGDTVTFTANPTGGTAPYSYVFGGCNHVGATATCTATYQTAGTFPNAVSVTATDSNGVGASASTDVTITGTGTINCSTNAQCGTNGPTGGLFCQGNNVYQNYITYTCNNPGTANSSCSNATNAQLQTTCTGSQTCNNGSCTGGGGAGTFSLQVIANPTSVNIGQTVTFTATPSGGTAPYSYVWGGCTVDRNSNNICTASYSTTGPQTAAVTVTDSNGVGATGSATITVNGGGGNCISNYQQRCSGSSLYWYDSCGNQQSLIQYCANGCSGNACNGGGGGYCSPNYQQRCSGNTLYWADSCGNLGSIIQYCANGCYGNTCQYTNYNYSGTYNYGYYSSGALTAIKTVKNLTSNNSGFSSSTYANPSDILLFMITLQANGGDVQNVMVRDILPANLIYRNQLVVARSNGVYNSYSGDVLSGISLNTVSAGQTVTISYQAQVAPAQNFSFGVTTLTNNVTVTSSSSGYGPTSNANVVVTRSGVLGASTVSTGLTNNIWFDSFGIPLIIALIGAWMWRSGLFFGVEKWLEERKKTRRGFKAGKELSHRISEIQRFGEKI